LPFVSVLFALATIATISCHRHGQEDGHNHTSGSAHAAEPPEPEPIAITRWTDRYELFVEIPPPVNGKPIEYHAHVTRLEDFSAVTEGHFVARYKEASGKVAREHAQTGAKRPGIFVFEGEGLPTGEYALEMQYEHAGQTDVWDCGTIAVLEKGPPAADERAETSITFLKETQWKIAFRTAWSEERSIRRQIEMTAIAEPAGSDQLTVGAPTGGRFLHEPKRPLAVGIKVKKGDLLGTVVPNVGDEDYSRLLFAVDEAALAKKQNDREIQRVEPLVKEGIVAGKRLIDLKNESELLVSRLTLAQQRLGALSGDSKKGLAVKAGQDGIVSEVLVNNGDTVENGAALVRLGGSTRLWLRAKTFSRGPFDDAIPAAMRLEAGKPLDLAALGAVFVTPAPVIDPATRVGTWIIDLGPKSEGLPSDLRPGTSVVVAARFGPPAKLVAVPVGAVVEIDTRPYVFVQVDGEHFEKRRVAVGPIDAGFIPILQGVEKAERVVTVGGFDIHLAAVMGTVESHRH